MFFLGMGVRSRRAIQEPYEFFADKPFICALITHTLLRKYILFYGKIVEPTILDEHLNKHEEL